MTDDALLLAALREAEKALHPAPNPFVGAVIARGNRIIARGHHVSAGTPHAEIIALQKAGSLARGATLAVTLEPCTHTGRTPPCAPALVHAGIARILIGMRDASHAGGGADYLRSHGLSVTTGIQESLCRLQNQPWLKSLTSPQPYTTLKLAAYPDGSTIPKKKWISCATSRRTSHLFRARADAILVGSGTVYADNPRLTTRGIPNAPHPLRVILAGTRPLPASAAFRAPLGDHLIIPSHPTPADVLALLATRGIQHLLIEGGLTIAHSFLAASAIDRIDLFIPGTHTTPPPALALALPPATWTAQKSGTDTHLTALLRQY